MNNYRYAQYLKTIKQWAAKHGISVDSAFSILFEDSAAKGQVTKNDLYWHEGEEFYFHYKNEK